MTDQQGSAAPTASVEDEALAWVIRMAEPDADWHAFTLWLEGDPARAARYDRAAVALQDAGQAVAALPLSGTSAAPEPRVAHEGVLASGRWRPARWIGGTIAAALVGAVGLGVWSEAPHPYAVQTAAGEQRIVALPDGSSIVLAGASRVRLDHGDARVASVEQGQMLFRVRHDARHPFAVSVGNHRLVDLGTVFDVKAAAGRTLVAVAKGAVMVDPNGAALRLDPGQAAVMTGGRWERRTVDPSDVASWREGRLAFDDAPLAEVAGDLSRQLGQRVSVVPSLAARTFRGTLDLRSLKTRPELLGTLLNVRVRQDAEGWTLEPAG
jgi:transmembrane sensor